MPYVIAGMEAVYLRKRGPALCVMLDVSTVFIGGLCGLPNWDAGMLSNHLQLNVQFLSLPPSLFLSLSHTLTHLSHVSS